LTLRGLDYYASWLSSPRSNSRNLHRDKQRGAQVELQPWQHSPFGEHPRAIITPFHAVNDGLNSGQAVTYAL
jgi:hypothetical protein